MSLKIEIGPTSQTAVELPIDYTSTFGKKQIASQHRTLSGNLYVYKHSAFIKHRFKVDFLSTENASIVNSWWENNTELLLFVSSGSGLPDAVIDYSEVFSDYAFIRTTRGVNSEDYVKIVEDSSSNNHYWSEAFGGLQQNTDLYYDVKVKKEERNKIRVTAYDGTNWVNALVHLDNGSHGYSVNSAYTFFTEITSEVDDFWRVRIGYRFTDVSTVLFYLFIMNSDDNSGYAGDGTSGIWAGDATLTGVVIDTEVHSVMILNKETPLNKFSRPYQNYYGGRLDLEGY